MACDVAQLQALVIEEEELADAGLWAKGREGR
eukprot:CAMPEP_0119535852 /NCGR_PEP_ID=MMETSP1344-20130328/48826_1 /TAXON_ID=236787 /ORGANISM="Florenciella parvula, Strain CCMP2471" /LENGTH=31 /DNA_ID= /DNA_START= /DNA_END= /DNA_ORIENTATION=